jgi:hypothetical protein
MATLKWPKKDPDDVLDYVIDWTALLDGDPITSVSHEMDAELTKGVETFSDTQTVVWISEGLPGNTYMVTATITTAGGRTFERSVQLVVVDR